MRIENAFTVPLSVDKVWNMLDVNAVVLCLPGAELTGVVDRETYEGRIDLKLGAAELLFKGTVKVTERDDQSHRATITVSGRDEQGKSQAQVKVTAQMDQRGDATTVKVSEDIELMGAIAEYRPDMVQDVLAGLMTQFANCVGKQLLQAA